MSVKKPLFPTTIGEQISDLHTKYNYLLGNSTRLGFSGNTMLELGTALTAVDTAHEKTIDKDHRTKLDTIKQTEALQAAHLLYRKEIEYHVANNPDATPGDYEALSVPVKGSNTHLPAPTHVPGIGHISSADLAVTVPFFDAQSEKRAKPDGVHGLEVYYKLGGEEPVDILQLNERAVDTATPLHLQFEFADEFKIAYLAFRWVGTRGDYGPWSEIYKITVAR